MLSAWDTLVVDGAHWRSTYYEGQAASVPEHSQLADLALRELGVADLFGTDGRARVTVVDLNATYFREALLRRTLRQGDDPDTRVEERLLPPPARFAGLPDYSYGPADWLNKNMTCPIGGPQTDDGRCHAFLGWLGGLNSVHFGSQATRMYAHYHAVALARAARARTLREQMTPDERRAYAEVLKEAEHQALLYEGYAQHFLQDRWAIGHMWERWDGPDRTQIANRSVWGTLAIGAVAGFIHGAEAEFNKYFDKSSGINADAMSSPLPGKTAARPMTFRHVSLADSPPVPAVGDERLADMGRGAFGRDYGGPDQPLDVAVQRSEMLTCSKAGWAEVIRALGPGPAGGYGEYGANLAPDAPNFAVVERETCWDMWATNRSMYVGFVGESGVGIAIIATLQLVQNTGLPGAAAGVEDVEFNSIDLSALAWRMWRRQWLDPEGTDLARGGLGSLINAPTGDRAGLPIYAEPIDPAALPTEAVGGVDRQTIFGALPRAHSDHWGGVEGLEWLSLLRRSDKDSLQQACQFVADMAWQGTHPGYAGPMSRSREAAGAPVRSLAQIRTGVRERETDDPRDPYFIDQGYVSRTEARDRAPTFGSKPAANWCARVPVVRLSRDPDLRNANIVQVLPADARRIELFGENFGLKKGRVLFFEEGRRKRGRGRIVDWSDGRIQVNFRPGELRAGRDHLIEIRTEDGRRSVGLFVVRVRPAEEELPETVPVAASCDAPPPQAAPFDLASAVTRRVGSDVFNAEPTALAGALRAASADLAAARAAPAAFLVSERQCLLNRRPGGVLAIDRVTREGRRAATREAEAYFEAQRAQGRSGGSWVKHCAASTGGPVRYGFTPAGVPFPEAGDFWLEYVDEIDGVLQHGEFAETFIAAWALALERRGPPLAPDPALTSGGLDLRIRDPEVVLQRYFRPLKGGTGELDRKLRQLQALRDADLWADAAMALYAATSRGIVARREYETWLTTGLRNQTRDPIDALCRVEAGLSRPPPEFVMAPPGFANSYRTRDGRRYARKGWPQMPTLPAQTTAGRVGSAPEPPSPFTPTPFAPPALPALPAPPRTIPLRRRRAGTGKPVPKPRHTDPGTCRMGGC